MRGGVKKSIGTVCMFWGVVIKSTDAVYMGLSWVFLGGVKKSTIAVLFWGRL